MLEIVHRPVLRDEILEYLAPPNPRGTLIDGTLGEGGHSLAFLERFPEINLVGIDADESVIPIAEMRLAAYSDRVEIRNVWFNQFFANYPQTLTPPTIVLLDLGISIFHYERSGRGFSFLKDELLDMRLSPVLEISASDIVNEYPEDEIANLIYQYGEERYSRRIAREIVRARSDSAIESTLDLVNIVERSVPPEYRHGRIHAATRTFQALRIAVNGELTRLEHALAAAFDLLEPGGRIGVISFHSLEDRIVKHFFRDLARDCTCPPDWPECRCDVQRALSVVTKRPVRPSANEIDENPPSRSAKLRVAEKNREAAS